MCLFSTPTGMCLLLENVGSSEQNRPVIANVHLAFPHGFWHCKVYADIPIGFPGEGTSNDSGASETAIIRAFAGYILGNFRDKASVII